MEATRVMMLVRAPLQLKVGATDAYERNLGFNMNYGSQHDSTLFISSQSRQCVAGPDKREEGWNE